MGSNPTSSEIKLKMFFQLQILAKDKKVLELFIKFFLNLQKASSTWQVVFNSKKRDVVTVLKSPHVNKTAQEQFEFRIFSAQVNVTTADPAKNLLFLKRLTKKLFHDISINLELTTNFDLAKKNELVDENKTVDNAAALISRYRMMSGVVQKKID